MPRHHPFKTKLEFYSTIFLKKKIGLTNSFWYSYSFIKKFIEFFKFCFERVMARHGTALHCAVRSRATSWPIITKILICDILSDFQTLCLRNFTIKKTWWQLFVKLFDKFNPRFMLCCPALLWFLVQPFKVYWYSKRQFYFEIDTETIVKS